MLRNIEKLVQQNRQVKSCQKGGLNKADGNADICSPATFSLMRIF